MDNSFGEESPLRILHVLRAPIGGLWRHVLDLTREQVARGHAVGIVADASTGGSRADAILHELAPSLSLGVSRVRMHRNPHPTDLTALAHITRRVMREQPDVVHGHGSKGGMFARLALASPRGINPVRAYTPHGGSMNYRPGSALHSTYMRVEAALQRRTDLILFESAFIASRYATFVGSMPRLHRVVCNGIAPVEFARVPQHPEATDFLYVGELRAAKGVDTLLAALARAGQFFGTAPSLTLVGSGPDRRELEQLAAAHNLSEQVTFREAMGARDAFALGKILVVPSRAESLPYVVLEAAAASLPILATNVGGIPEIFGPLKRRLIPPNSVPALCERLIEMHNMSPEQRDIEARNLHDYVRSQFNIARMVDGVLASYRDAKAARSGIRFSAAPSPAALAH